MRCTFHRLARPAAMMLLALLVTGLTAAHGAQPAAAASSLPVPSSWDIVANGWDALLTLTSLDEAGNRQGTLTFTLSPQQPEPISGFWAEEDQKITFHRGTAGNPSSWQIFTGYYFRALDDGHPEMLAGSFEAFGGRAGGSAVRPVYGWYATALRDSEFPEYGGAGHLASRLTLFRNALMNSHGTTLRLTISSVDAAGNFTGEINDSRTIKPISGLFDSNAQKVTFVRPGDPNDPKTQQFYTGYLITRLANPRPDRVWLAGSFVAFNHAGGTARRSVYGWVAGPVDLPPLIGGGCC